MQCTIFYWSWFKKKSYKRYYGEISNGLGVLDSIREFLLIWLDVIMVLCLDRKLSLFFREAIVLVFDGCFNKLPQTRGLNNINLLTYSLEISSLKWVSLG